MSGKQENKFDGLAAEEERQKIEDAVTRPIATSKSKKRGVGATTITLAISREDKTLLKSWAALHGTSMSEMLHGWIEQTCIEK